MLTISILLDLTLFHEVKWIRNFQLNFSLRIRKYIMGSTLCVYKCVRHSPALTRTWTATTCLLSPAQCPAINVRRKPAVATRTPSIPQRGRAASPTHSPTPTVLFTVWKLPAVTRSSLVPSLHLSSINRIKRFEASNLCSIDWAELWPLQRFQIICFHLSPLFHSILFQLKLTVSLQRALIAPASPCQGNETLAAKVRIWATNFPTSFCKLLHCTTYV